MKMYQMSLLESLKQQAMVYVEHLHSILISLWKYIELKAASGAVIAILGFFFNLDHKSLLLALVGLITFDLIMGVAAAKKTGECIESRKMCKSAFKLAVYGVMVSSAHLTEVAVGLENNWAVLEQMMIGFLAATELVSIIENAGRMGYAVPKRILNQLQQYRGEGSA